MLIDTLSVTCTSVHPMVPSILYSCINKPPLVFIINSIGSLLPSKIYNAIYVFRSICKFDVISFPLIYTALLFIIVGLQYFMIISHESHFVVVNGGCSLNHAYFSLSCNSLLISCFANETI